MFRTYSVLSALQKRGSHTVGLCEAICYPIQRVGFKSHLSVDKIYPNSNPDFLRNADDSKTGNQQKNVDAKEQFSGYIPIEELEISASKSSGPGGQHVNKVNSKVEVRFHLSSASWIPDWVKPKLIEQEHSRLTKDGFLIVRSDTTRKQMLNQAECMDKLRNMVFKASTLPREPTKEELKVKEERLARAKAGILREKKNRSLLKKSRSAPDM